MASLFRQTLFLITGVRAGTTHTGTKVHAAIFHQTRVFPPWTTITTSLKPFSTKSTGRPPEKPRLLPTSGFETIDVNQPVEEEDLPDYKADRFYPVKLGDVFQDRYQIMAKLGFGSSSTSWLARDLK